MSQPANNLSDDDLLALQQQWPASNSGPALPGGELTDQEPAALINDAPPASPSTPKPVPPAPNIDSTLALLERYMASRHGPGLPGGELTLEELAFAVKDCPPGTWKLMAPGPLTEKDIDETLASGAFSFSTPTVAAPPTAAALSPSVALAVPALSCVSSTTSAPTSEPVVRPLCGVVSSPCRCLSCLHSRSE